MIRRKYFRKTFKIAWLGGNISDRLSFFVYYAETLPPNNLEMRIDYTSTFIETKLKSIERKVKLLDQIRALAWAGQLPYYSPWFCGESLENQYDIRIA